MIFQENVSFDHYFGTYPNAANTDGSPFYASPGTPTVNGLSGALLTNNPNWRNPQRLSHSQAAHVRPGPRLHRRAEGLRHGPDGQVHPVHRTSRAAQPPDGPAAGDLVMDYYDGNTVTGLWNYAQHFAMSDNSYSTTFGPSTPGAINVTAANTFGAICGPTQRRDRRAGLHRHARAARRRPAGQPQPQGRAPTYSDADPNCDICSGHRRTTRRRPRRSRWAARTSAICSTRPGSPGDGSRAASPARATSRVSRAPTICQGLHRHARQRRRRLRRRLQTRTTSRSSTTPRRPTRCTCRRPRSR